MWGDFDLGQISREALSGPKRLSRKSLANRVFGSNFGPASCSPYSDSAALAEVVSHIVAA